MHTTNSGLDVIDSFSLLILVIIVGDFRVGKTSLCQKISKSEISTTLHPTIAIEFHSSTINLKGSEFHVKLWDTCNFKNYESWTR